MKDWVKCRLGSIGKRIWKGKHEKGRYSYEEEMDPSNQRKRERERERERERDEFV